MDWLTSIIISALGFWAFETYISPSHYLGDESEREI
jgi:hypothetical protein